MGTEKKIKMYIEENFEEVLHTTLNPDGPGVVRIHLIPPKFDEEDEPQVSVAIINGQDIVPVNLSWTILLCEFIKQVNKYAGRPITDDGAKSLVEETCKGVRKVFWLLPKKKIKEDIYRIMNAFTQIARGKEPDEPIGLLSLSEYAPYMQAPHRMDLMVSAMTKNGRWHCNQNCVHCYAAGQMQSDEQELSTEQWKKIIDNCRDAGIPQLTFTGGEPTMREDLPELIEYAKWFVSRLNTNGIKLTEEYCGRLAESKLDSLQITFYSADSEIHNSLVGADRYHETVSGIKNALTANLNLSVNTPLCTVNRDYVKTLELLHELGVTYVTCSGLITTGNAASESSESMQLTSPEIRDILRAATDYCYANGMEIAFTSPGWVTNEFCAEIGITTPSCGACLSNMAVTPGGNVVPCQSWLSGAILGNMLTDEWHAIWNSDTCKTRREYSSQMRGDCPLRIRPVFKGEVK